MRVAVVGGRLSNCAAKYWRRRGQRPAAMVRSRSTAWRAAVAFWAGMHGSGVARAPLRRGAAAANVVAAPSEVDVLQLGS